MHGKNRKMLKGYRADNTRDLSPTAHHSYSARAAPRRPSDAPPPPLHPTRPPSAPALLRQGLGRDGSAGDCPWAALCSGAASEPQGAAS